MSYDYYGPGYQPPQAYYPQVAPPPYVPPPRRRPEQRFWAFWILVGIILVSVGVAVPAALSLSSSPRVQDTQSYQLGYNEIGPKAAQVFGDVGSCSVFKDAWLVHYREGRSASSVPSWWDDDKVMQGCMDYQDATDSYGQYLHHHQGLGG
jgi:hypothetical protein